MTLSEALELAESGKIFAMMYLGDFFYSQINEGNDEAQASAYENALKWYEKAAHLGNINAMYKTAFLYYSDAFSKIILVVKLYSYEETRPVVEKSYHWYCRIQQIDPNFSHSPMRSLDGPLKNFHVVTYYTALLTFFQDDDNATAAQIVSNPWDDSSAILRGVARYQASPPTTFDEYRMICSDISRIVGNASYAAKSKCDLEEFVYAMAAFILSEHWVKGYYGCAVNISAAYNILQYVKSNIKDNCSVQVLDQALSHFQPKLFGGYRYVE